jgi:hypothetical protein
MRLITRFEMAAKNESELKSSLYIALVDRVKRIYRCLIETSILI